MNIKMSEADTEAQKQEAIDLTLLIAKVRNEALEEAAKDIGTWAWNKSSAAGKLTSGAVFTSHTWQDARDVVLALKVDTT